MTGSVPTRDLVRVLRQSFASLAAATALVAFDIPSLEAGGADFARRSVTILHTNDFHGRHLPIVVAPGSATAQTGDSGERLETFDRSGEVGGFAAIAAIVTAVRNSRGTVLLTHGGDTFSDDLLGNLTKGEAVVRLMNAVGYDFMALGNHDFDYGVERTRELQRIASFPMRGANVIDAATGEPFLGEPFRIVEQQGLRIGLLALGYHNTPLTSSPENTRSLRFLSGVDAGLRYVPELRRSADLIVVVSHQGVKIDELLAREVEGIDLILGGHSHDLIAPPRKVGNTWIAQARSDGTVLYELTLEVTGKTLTSVRAEPRIPWTDTISPDPDIARLVAELRAPHRHLLEEVVATASEWIGRQYKSESPFDVLVGEILREHTGAETAFLPGVGYGVDLSPGPVTREALYSLLPHPARVAVVEITGKQILEILEQSSANLKPSDPLAGVGGVVQTSGITWVADLARPIGDRVIDVKVGAAELVPERRYTAATHSGMLAGIHNYGTFARAATVEKRDMPLSKLVEAEFRRRGMIQRPELGRASIINYPK